MNATSNWRIQRVDTLDDALLNGLADLLIDCVQGGASVSFMLPLDRERALVFWRRVADDAVAGRRALLVAHDAQGICGSVQLSFDLPENQPHRADLAKMLVHRRMRRQGLGAALLKAAEAEALSAGKTLLVLDAVTGGEGLGSMNGTAGSTSATSLTSPSTHPADSAAPRSTTDGWASSMVWPKRLFVAFLLVWQTLLTLFLTLAGLENRDLYAMSGMLWGLDVLWIGGTGLLSVMGRDSARSLVRRIALPEGPKFWLFVTGLALVEEAIATLMTNCAPLFGVAVGEVYITASANYVDVVVFHSVVVFLPQFAAWAWLLSRYAFSPFAVFVLYGLTGLVNETLFAGPQILTAAQWILVYGLMVYLGLLLSGTA